MADKKSLVNIDFRGSSSIKNLPSASPASGDHIALTDESDGGKVKKGPSFGTNDGTFLRKDGVWATPSGGGTTKYLHNICAWWSGGSGYNYRSGTISFSFYDTNPNSYEDTSGDMDVDGFKAFMAAHCGMTKTGYQRYPVSGSVQLQYPCNEIWNVTAIVNVTGGVGGLWYVAGGCIYKSTDGTIGDMYSAIEEINYLDTAMENQYIRMTDTVQ